MAEENEDTRKYRVLVNDEEQYSLWLASKDIPLGWHDTSVSGAKEECLTYVNKVWVDMRPKSLREAMAKMEKEKKS